MVFENLQLDKMSSEIRKDVLKLMDQKDNIEKEIKALTEILTQNGVGMDDSLVDAEGFPKSSIDIYQVRHARHSIICLQNDHKAIMKQIENGLQGYYSSVQENSSNEINIQRENKTEKVIYEDPFATVTIVSEGSPAALAGIEENDMIVEFGSVNITNFKNIQDIATVVRHSENKPVNLKLKRGDNFHVVQLIPKKWTGRGLIGCNIVEI